jgi:WD40 repeat protein
MHRAVARWLPWLLLVGIGALHGLAYALPAVLVGGTDGQGRPLPPWHLSGLSAYRWAWSLRDYLWLANPLFWLATGLLSLRLWLWSGLAAGGAFAIAISTVVRTALGETADTYLAGYWLWSGTMAGLAVTGLLGWALVPAQGQRRARALLAGWRGLGLGSALVAAAAGFSVFWFADKLWPPPDPDEQVVVETLTTGDIRFELELKGHMAEYSAAPGKDYLRAQAGPNRVHYEDGILVVNEVDYGSLRPGDRVRITPAGEVRVNDQPRPPYPIQPRRITAAGTVLAGHTADTWSVDWARTDLTLVSGSRDRTARLWDVGRRQEVRTFPHEHEVWRAALSPSGRLLATAGRADTVTLWDVTSGEQLAVLAGPRGFIGGLAFLSDDWLAVAHDKKLYAHHLAGDRTKRELLASVAVMANRPFAVSADRRTLVCCDGQTARAFRLTVDADRCQAEPEAAIGSAGNGSCVALSRDGSLVALFDGYRFLNVHETATGKRKASLRWRADRGFATQISSLAFSPDGQTLAVGDLTTVRLYDVSSGREWVWFVAVADQMRWVRYLAFSPDGKLLAGALGEGPGPHLKIWEVKTLLAAPTAAGR